MAYDYQTQRPNIFTEDGQVMFLAIRDNAFRLIRSSGAAMMGHIISNCGGGDSWNMLACVDRLVELDELREVALPHPCAAQHRIFISPK